VSLLLWFKPFSRSLTVPYLFFFSLASLSDIDDEYERRRRAVVLAVVAVMTVLDDHNEEDER